HWGRARRLLVRGLHRLPFLFGALVWMGAQAACAADSPTEQAGEALRRRLCGNGVCNKNSGETCSSCAKDCGPCATADAGAPSSSSSSTDGGATAPPGPGSSSTGPNYPLTIGWLGGIGPENFMAQLDNLSYYHFGGIKYPVWYGGIPDALK